MFDLIKVFKKLPKSNWNSAAVGGPPQHAFLPQHIQSNSFQVQCAQHGLEQGLVWLSK